VGDTLGGRSGAGVNLGLGGKLGADLGDGASRVAGMVILVALVAAGAMLGVIVVAVRLLATAVWAGLFCWLGGLWVGALLVAVALTILHALTHALLKARLLVVVRLLGVVSVGALWLVRLVLMRDLNRNRNTLILTLERVGVDIVFAVIIDRTCPEVIRLVERQMSCMVDGKSPVTL
jgi:hypothetical protein